MAAFACPGSGHGHFGRRRLPSMTLFGSPCPAVPQKSYVSRAPRRQQAVPFLAPPSGSLQTKEAHHANSRFTSAQLIGLQRPVPGQNRAPGRLHKRLSGTSSKNKKMRRTRGTRDRRLGLVFWTNQGVAD
jgi:hypothetical protein